MYIIRKVGHTKDRKNSSRSLIKNIGSKRGAFVMIKRNMM